MRRYVDQSQRHKAPEIQRALLWVRPEGRQLGEGGGPYQLDKVDRILKHDLICLAGKTDVSNSDQS